MTDKLSVVTQAVVDKLKAYQAPTNLFSNNNVYFGDEQLIPRVPSAVVNPDPGYTAELTGTGMQKRNTFSLQIILYHAKLGEGNIRRKEVVELAEGVMDYLHEDRQFGGMLYHSFVNSIEPGYQQLMDRTFMVATKIGWEGYSKTHMT